MLRRVCQGTEELRITLNVPGGSVPGPIGLDARDFPDSDTTRNSADSCVSSALQLEGRAEHRDGKLPIVTSVPVLGIPL
jgi:hypothetical protein